MKGLTLLYIYLAVVFDPISFVRGLVLSGRNRNSTQRCAVDDTPPVVLTEMELEYKAAISKNSSGSSLFSLTAPSIPPISVYFHVIGADQTQEQGWIKDEEILAQMNTTNFDFRGTGLSFVLVNISRTQDALWFADGFQNTLMRQALHVGGPTDLNIYTVSCNGDDNVIGIASLPGMYSNSPMGDGVTICHTTLPGGSATNYNLGHTLTHEIGHWVGLAHTFQGGCEDSVGDGVDDTPPEAIPGSTCDAPRDTCPGGGSDPINNFMDYSQDQCLSQFTNGQILRMHAQISQFRGIGT